MNEAATRPLSVAPREEVREVHFDRRMETEIAAILAKYPHSAAALLPVLWLCQERWGWISPGIMRAIGDRLGLSPSYVEGVASFYTMYQRKPPGRFLVQVCTTLSCRLCGTSDLVDHLKDTLDIDFGETTADGQFTLVEVQCLGACGEAPVIQINDDYYTGLTPEELDGLLGRLAAS
jgi:NADH-quinone oxidoreductase E subunit